MPFSKDALECLDIDFFEVSFYGSLIDLTYLPCINGGYDHAAEVRLRDSQWRKPRLVTGAERETCITGRSYLCRACERKYCSLQASCKWSSNSSASGTLWPAGVPPPTRQL